MSTVKMWAAVLLFTVAPIVASISTISTSGTKFYDSDGNQFYIKGVAYGSYSSAGGPNLADVLADTAQCLIDVSLMRKLGINTVRVYYIDSTENHDGCMAVFENAGIYVLVELDSLDSQINEIAPEWTSPQYSNFTAVMDAFAEYNNTLGFFVGNNVVDNMSSLNTSLYVKASALDLKKYRDEKGYRNIPVGYASRDSTNLLPMLQNYLACGTDAIDFYALNSYSWCGNSTFYQSGFSEYYAYASSLNIPIFFSETGCAVGSIVLPSRDFSEMDSIFGFSMKNLWSGAIVFEWSQDSFGNGLVGYISTTLSGTPTPVATGGFSDLMSRWATLRPTGTPSSLDTPNFTPPSCPSITASGWSVSGDAPLPTLNKAVVSTGTTSSLSSLIQGSSSTSTSGAGTGDGSDYISNQVSKSDGGLSSATIAGIAIGIILLFKAGAIVVYLLWRRGRLQNKVSPSLDLTPEGLEVGEPPPKPELDSSEAAIEHESKPELQDTSPPTGLNGPMLDSGHALTTSTFGPSEMGISPISQRASTTLASELPTAPATPKLSRAKHKLPVTRHSLPSSNSSSLKANAPWEIEAFPYLQLEVPAAQAQQTPLFSTTDDDELRRLQDEERRIDAQITESECTRSLKQERLLLQARKTALLAAKEKSGRN